MLSTINSFQKLKKKKRCAEQDQRPYRRGNTIIVKDGGLKDRTAG